MVLLKGKALTLFRMGLDIKVNFLMTNPMAEGNIPTQAGAHAKEILLTENLTVKGNLYIKTGTLMKVT